MSDTLTEEELLRIIEEDDTEVTLNWIILDDFLYENNIKPGDYLTHFMVLIYMYYKWKLDKNIPGSPYLTLREQVFERFEHLGNGRIKTTSMEAWELWKKEEKQIRQSVKILRKQQQKRRRQNRRRGVKTRKRASNLDSSVKPNEKSTT